MAGFSRRGVAGPNRALSRALYDRFEKIGEVVGPAMDELSETESEAVEMLCNAVSATCSEANALWAVVDLHLEAAQEHSNNGSDGTAAELAATARGVALATRWFISALAHGLGAADTQDGYEIRCRFDAIVGDLRPEFAALIAKLLGDAEDGA